MILSGKTSDDIRGSLVPKDVILLACLLNWLF